MQIRINESDFQRQNDISFSELFLMRKSRRLLRRQNRSKCAEKSFVGSSANFKSYLSLIVCHSVLKKSLKKFARKKSFAEMGQH